MYWSFPLQYRKNSIPLRKEINRKSTHLHLMEKVRFLCYLLGLRKEFLIIRWTYCIGEQKRNYSTNLCLRRNKVDRELFKIRISVELHDKLEID